MKQIIILIGTLFALTHCGGGESHNDTMQFSENCNLRVTNGAECATGYGPIALLELLDKAGELSGICSGVFISSQHILTAAHCFEDNSVAANVRVGADSIRSAAIAIPSSFTEQKNILSPTDFAIVTLETEVSRVQTLPFLISEPIKPGVVINIAGYGQDENGNSALDGTSYENGLQHGTMVVSELDHTKRLFAAEYNSTNQSVCLGDSGGPAIVVNKDGLPGIIAVTQALYDPNHSSPACLDDSISVFTNMQSQANLDFVLSIVPGAGII
jgi:secreted trypsin-like serine protease